MKSRQHIHVLSIFTLAASLIVATGCSTSPKKLETAQKQEQAQFTPEQLLGMARQADFPGTKNQYLMQAASQYWSSGLIGQAKAALLDVDPVFLSSETRDQYQLYQLELGLLENNTVTVSDAINALNLSELIRKQPQDSQDLLRLFESAYNLLEQPLKAAILLVDNAELLPEESQANEKIWSYLSQANALAINEVAETSPDYQLRGWAQLLSRVRYQETDLQAQHDALLEWQANWLEHPASIAPPKELQLLARLPEIKPRNIILALPFNGPLKNVAESIRDGFIAHFYQSSESNAGELKISFFDTYSRDFLSLYEQDLDPNTIIIGPISKDTLNLLLMRESVPYKTLVLNSAPAPYVVENLFQYSLNPEQETAQIAARLAQEGRSRIAAIAPDTDWGQRIMESFQTQISAHHGRLVSKAYYKNQQELSQAVSKMVATDHSKQRARRIRQITGLNLESTPRRRQDIDAVFMLAKPEYARQLKPLLAYHYASDLPVYAGSQVHDSSSGSDDRDLNGIRFVDMPWTLSTAIDIKGSIARNQPSKAEKYSRFYAMGVDAFAIAPRLQLLTQVENSYIVGQTGRLSVGPDNHVNRELQWARFRNGRAIID